MSKRAPSSPPLLEGFRHTGLLGSGGFADVFAYEQLSPVRQVAVKVLLRGLGGQTPQHFESEANLMAKLSNHPSIVTIYAAGVAADGRPYLVMELCQPGHLGVRIRQRPLSVARALEVGIQIAGAVETAHRLGIRHRDIKPANILFTEFGRPALTDFGISTDASGAGAAAFSVIWAPPEQLVNAPMGPAGDVYALAGTVWAMLTGRSPFEVRGDNEALAVSTRVRTMPLPPTGRADVPESLERVLRTAMAKRPEQRYASMLEFARALQGVQAELRLSVTTIDVLDESPGDYALDLTHTGTRVTGFLDIDPDPAPGRTDSASVDLADSFGTRATGLPSTAWPVAAGAVLQHGRGSRPAVDPLDFTGPELPQLPRDRTAPAPAVVPVPVPPAAEEPARSRLGSFVVVGVLVAVAGIGVTAALSGRLIGTTAPTPTASAPPADPVVALVPAPTEIQGVVAGAEVEFSWTVKHPEATDRFLYRPVLPGQEPAVQETDEARARVAVQPGRTCIEVALVRGGRASDTVTGCEPA